ncbi:uncharacterized protein LOC106156044 isoform X2 [Lingula anatina]|uniref:Uncharacterized protein LOC106156044 isoform X2 n=1 Tax=Lingula anatina TaxID=7574 RepID=A0A1S3HM74_LINAN|nr:uncharacterized protein LOC106156044 isoform X2 [Lingula anatina]|eukprot:XP_013386581.1 uncharacterized protein LOC106156044 isoform X2 [Lingula anatina]
MHLKDFLEKAKGYRRQSYVHVEEKVKMPTQPLAQKEDWGAELEAKDHTASISANESRKNNTQNVLLGKHLQQYHEWVETQPKRHTEQQIRQEKWRLEREESKAHQEELDRLRAEKEAEFYKVLGNLKQKEQQKECENTAQQQQGFLTTTAYRKADFADTSQDGFGGARKKEKKEKSQLRTKGKNSHWKPLDTSYREDSNCPEDMYTYSEDHDGVWESEKKDPWQQQTASSMFVPNTNYWEERKRKQSVVNELQPKSQTEEAEMLMKALALSLQTARMEEEEAWHSEKQQACGPAVIFHERRHISYYREDQTGEQEHFQGQSYEADINKTATEKVDFKAALVNHDSLPPFRHGLTKKLSSDEDGACAAAAWQDTDLNNAQPILMQSNYPDRSTCPENQPGVTLAADIRQPKSSHSASVYTGSYNIIEPTEDWETEIVDVQYDCGNNTAFPQNEEFKEIDELPVVQGSYDGSSNAMLEHVSLRQSTQYVNRSSPENISAPSAADYSVAPTLQNLEKQMDPLKTASPNQSDGGPAELHQKIFGHSGDLNKTRETMGSIVSDTPLEVVPDTDVSFCNSDSLSLTDIFSSDLGNVSQFKKQEGSVTDRNNNGDVQVQQKDVMNPFGDGERQQEDCQVDPNLKDETFAIKVTSDSSPCVQQNISQELKSKSELLLGEDNPSTSADVQRVLSTESGKDSNLAESQLLDSLMKTLPPLPMPWLPPVMPNMPTMPIPAMPMPSMPMPAMPMPTLMGMFPLAGVPPMFGPCLPNNFSQEFYLQHLAAAAAAQLSKYDANKVINGAEGKQQVNGESAKLENESSYTDAEDLNLDNKQSTTEITQHQPEQNLSSSVASQEEKHNISLKSQKILSAIHPEDKYMEGKSTNQETGYRNIERKLSSSNPENTPLYQFDNSLYQLNSNQNNSSLKRQLIPEVGGDSKFKKGSSKTGTSSSIDSLEDIDDLEGPLPTMIIHRKPKSAFGPERHQPAIPPQPSGSHTSTEKLNDNRMEQPSGFSRGGVWSRHGPEQNEYRFDLKQNKDMSVQLKKPTPLPNQGMTYNTKRNPMKDFVVPSSEDWENETFDVDFTQVGHTLQSANLTYSDSNRFSGESSGSKLSNITAARGTLQQRDIDSREHYGYDRRDSHPEKSHRIKTFKFSSYGSGRGFARTPVARHDASRERPW